MDTIRKKSIGLRLRISRISTRLKPSKMIYEVCASLVSAISAPYHKIRVVSSKKTRIFAKTASLEGSSLHTVLRTIYPRQMSVEAGQVVKKLCGANWVAGATSGPSNGSGYVNGPPGFMEGSGPCTRGKRLPHGRKGKALLLSQGVPLNRLASESVSKNNCVTSGRLWGSLSRGIHHWKKLCACMTTL